MLAVTPGNMSDYTPAQDCIGAVPPAKHLIADKGYDSNALRDWLKSRGTEPVIPPRSNRKVQLRYDKKLYRERNRIERSFGSFMRRVELPSNVNSGAAKAELRRGVLTLRLPKVASERAHTIKVLPKS